MGGYAPEPTVLALIHSGLLIGILLIILLQPGYMMFLLGATSRKNAINTIYRAFAGTAVAALAFVLIGRDFSNGIGPLADLARQAGLAVAPEAEPLTPRYFDGIIEIGLALAAHMIAFSATAGRMTLFGTVLFSALFAAIVYPLCALLVWNSGGLLHEALPDFAGGAAIHLTGAAAALAAALILRPRVGFNGFDPVNIGDKEELFKITALHAPHNAPLAAQGVVWVWLGFIGLAAALQLNSFATTDPEIRNFFPTQHLDYVTGKSTALLTNLALAPVGAILVSALIHALWRQDPDYSDMLSAVPAGLAAIAAAADTATPEAALMLGGAGALFAIALRNVLVLLSVDDPLAAVSTHGGAAVIGLGLGSVASEPSLEALLASLPQLGLALSLFASIFGVSLAALIAAELISKVVAIATGRSKPRTALTRMQLRVAYDDEIFGLDEMTHGQSAYNLRQLNPR